MARDRHAEQIERTADVIVAAVPVPVRILMVGCGEGALLRELAVRVPDCEAYVGVDAAADLDRVARGSDSRLQWTRALPGALPFAPASFDLVVADDAAASWPGAGPALGELARVVAAAGTIVLVEQASAQRRGGGDAADRAVAAAGLRVHRRESIGRPGRSLSTVHAAIIRP